MDLILRISPSNPMSQIANAHIAFNVITAAILLPFGNSIVSLSKKVLHGMNGKPDERDSFIWTSIYWKHRLSL